MQTKERPLKASSYRRALKVIRQANGPDIVIARGDYEPDVVGKVGDFRVYVEYKRPANLQRRPPNAFLMGAGLAFDLGAIFGAPTVTTKEALARDGAAIARDMWVALRRRISAKPRPR